MSKNDGAEALSGEDPSGLKPLEDDNRGHVILEHPPPVILEHPSPVILERSEESYEDSARLYDNTTMVLTLLRGRSFVGLAPSSRMTIGCVILERSEESYEDGARPCENRGWL